MAHLQSVLPISVIIPTYNRAACLKRALQSVSKQSRQCSEIIVVDDCSSDESEQLLEIWSNTIDIPLRYLKLSENSGPAKARNVGIESSRYPFIAFLDSDDHWHRRKLERQYRLLAENPDYLICHTWEKWLRNGLHLNQKKIHIPRHGNIFDHCLRLCAVGMSTVMAKRTLFDKVGLFDESMRCCEDYDMWLRVSCTFEFLLLAERLTIKEGGRADQVSIQYRLGMDQFRVYSIRKILQSGKLTEAQTEMAIHEMVRKATVFGKGCIKHGKSEMGQQFLNLADQYQKMQVQRLVISKGIDND